MQISSDTVLFLTDDKRDLTVCLKTDKSVDNVTSGILEFLCPVDVVLFIKSRFKFNEYHYLLAVLGCFEERCDDRRPVGYTVKSLLYRKNIRISCRLLNELQYRFERLIRVMDDPVLFPDLLENIEF